MFLFVCISTKLDKLINEVDDLTVSAFDHLGGKVDAPISLSHQSENLVEVVFTQRLAMGVYTLVLETGLMTYKDKLVVKL